MPSIQFGGKITAQWKSAYQSSSNWKDGSFKNLVATQTGIDWRRLPDMLCKQIRGHKEGHPKSKIPIAAFDKTSFLQQSEHAKYIWYGHSAMLMRLNGQSVLIDPMFGPDSSPIGPKRTKRFSDHSLSIIDDLPDIDLMLLTHDHYDHLDYESITRLNAKTKRYFVALGVKRHLLRWGVDEKKIVEFDWWETHTRNGIHVTFTPTRHFSGRGITSLAKCLWGGWALQTAAESIWFSGDGGYGDHFKVIGERLGPFDFALMECGQYGVDWPQIHMFPNESVQAALDAKVKVAMPVHWAAFNLSYQHAWYEPVEEFVRYADQQSLKYLTPSIGEIFDPTVATGHWWTKFK